jgi:hypothetical protein
VEVEHYEKSNGTCIIVCSVFGNGSGGCGSSSQTSSSAQDTSSAADSRFPGRAGRGKGGLRAGVGGLGDQSYNDLIYEGIEQGQRSARRGFRLCGTQADFGF